MAELAVVLDREVVGRLSLRPDGGMTFEYSPAYKGPPVSASMPVGPVTYDDRSCRAVFGGLLPEGRQRELLAGQLHVSAGNDFALLDALGGDVAGALALLPDEMELPATQQKRVVSSRELAELIESVRVRPLAVQRGKKLRMSLAGAQPKLPIILSEGEFFLPGNEATPTTHIIKPEPEAFPGSVDNEAFCMDLASELGLTTAKAEKRITSEGLPFLLVERYDRDLTDDPIRRLHQEDTCQALGLPSDRKYQAEGGPSISEVADLVREFSAVPARDLSELWNCLVFNWMIGNCDAHGKNFSMLYESQAPALAPFYDLLGTALYEDLTTQMAMRVGDAWELSDVTRDSFLEQAMQSGFSRSFAAERIDRLTDAVEAAAERLSREERHQNEAVRSIRIGIRDRVRSG